MQIYNFYFMLLLFNYNLFIVVNTLQLTLANINNLLE